MTRIVTPSRLHFGLFSVPTSNPPQSSEARAFGGVGLMIDRPNTIVTVRAANAWQIEGPLANRAQIFARRFLASLPDFQDRIFQILIEQCPPEHAGFGVGTQLGLAVAKGLALELGHSLLITPDIAERIGRGERSAVGVHGFDHGGLIVEAGKLPGESISPLLTRVELPAHWRVVLFQPHAHGNWHGDLERQAFESAKSGEERSRLTERLMHIARRGILPAASSADLPAFGEAVHEFNRLAGEPFIASQGGTYASREIEELIAAIRNLGIAGVGQSSWGPMVFAFTQTEAEANRLAFAIRKQQPGLAITIAKPSARGAEITVEMV